MIRLVRSELLKIRTTNIWWLYLIAVVGFTGLTFMANAVEAHQALTFDPGNFPTDMPPDQVAQMQAQFEAQRDVVGQTANLATSGQYFGLLFVMLLAVLVVTNEFFHQTATATYLTTPNRVRVIAGKLLAGAGLGAVFWLVTEALVVPATLIYMNADGFGGHLGHPRVVRAIALNLAVYAIWAVLGIGLGTLIRNQIGAVITAAVLYLIAYPAAFTVFGLMAYLTDSQWWVEKAIVIVPPIASSLLTDSIRQPHLPPQWVGAVVLLGYAIVFGGVGVLITRRRDIS